MAEVKTIIDRAKSFLRHVDEDIKEVLEKLCAPYRADGIVYIEFPAPLVYEDEDMTVVGINPVTQGLSLVDDFGNELTLDFTHLTPQQKLDVLTTVDSAQCELFTEEDLKD